MRAPAILAMVLATAGCTPAPATSGGPSTTPGTAKPAATAKPASASPKPSSVPSSATSAQPTATPSAAPTATAAPTASPTATPSAAPVAAAFKADVAPIFKAKCFGCHAAGQAGSSDVTIFDDADAVRHDEVSAHIANIVVQTTSGNMPRGGRPRLTEAELATLKAWQAAGSPND